MGTTLTCRPETGHKGWLSTLWSWEAAIHAID